MEQVIVNKKKISVESGMRFFDVLSEGGVVFPCGGKGVCGRCKITSRETSPTSLDKKFLTEREISDGIRLACDKVFCRENVITFDETNARKQSLRKLSSCRIIVSIGVETIDIGILDDVLVEIISIENPISKMGGSACVIADYEKDAGKISRLLRAAIGKELVECFEFLGVAKAEHAVIAANEFYLKILTQSPLEAESDYEKTANIDKLSLPADNIIVLPYIDNFIGGDMLAESIRIKEPALIIDCEKCVSFLSITEEDTVAASMWDFDYDDSEISERILRAAVRVMTEGLKTKPICYVFGTYKETACNVLIALDMPYIEKVKSMDSLVSCLSPRARARLDKEKARTSAIFLHSNELFQRYLTE